MIPEAILKQLEKMFEGNGTQLIPKEAPKTARLFLVYDGCYIFLTTEENQE